MTVYSSKSNRSSSTIKMQKTKMCFRSQYFEFIIFLMIVALVQSYASNQTESFVNAIKRKKQGGCCNPCSHGFPPYTRASGPASCVPYSRSGWPALYGYRGVYPSYNYLYSAWRSSLFDRVKTCDDIFLSGSTTSGVYTLKIFGLDLQLYCEFNLQGYHWMVIQRRIDGRVDFFQNWVSYQQGFGDLMAEYWLGLNAIHQLTRALRSPILRIDLEDFMGNKVFAEYRHFLVQSEPTDYRLSVSGYRGTAGDSLAYHNGFPFSTFDRDHDFHYLDRNCAEDYHGAWWYRSCAFSNLNGMHLTGGPVDRTGIFWYQWKQDFTSLKAVSMKIREF